MGIEAEIHAVGVNHGTVAGAVADYAESLAYMEYREATGTDISDESIMAFCAAEYPSYRRAEMIDFFTRRYL